MGRYVYSNEGRVTVEGLNSFIREMKKVEPSLVVQIAEANFDAATEITDAARKKAEGIGWPGSARKAAEGTLKASKSARRAMVRLGGAKAPYALGAEFGAKRYKQFAPWRGNQWSGFDSGVGYFLHPAIRESWPAAREAYLTRIDLIMKQPFPE